MDMPSEGVADLIQQLMASQSSLKDLVKRPLGLLACACVYFYVCVCGNYLTLFFLGVECARMQAEWPGHVRADQPDLRRDCLGCGLAASSFYISLRARARVLAGAG